MHSEFDFSHYSHRRFNPLTNSWVLCSPHRTQRPWQGKTEEDDPADRRPQRDPTCYLCPGNTRAGGLLRNPDYTTTFVFENDFPAVQRDQPSFNPQAGGATPNPLLRTESVRGECHVICFTPRHDKTMAEMTEPELLPVIDTWTDLFQTLSVKDHVGHVQIFENKGAIMGCSNPHPHGQCWATEDIPQEPATELLSLRRYREEHPGRCLLCDYVKTEQDHDRRCQATSSPTTAAAAAITTHAKVGTTTEPEGTRIVCENASFVCVVPFWAIWPFETLVLAKQHVATLADLDDQQKRDLANILRRITCRYDNLFHCSFPYSMGIHQAPCVTTTNNEHADEMHGLAHLHLHFYPPLLRSATVKKFLVGFELMAQAQRDLTPEQAARRLIDCSEVHYKTLANTTSTTPAKETS
ncbi:hypothetical protein DFQ27_007737 [Actinomortierella ambigua]|uniref:Galactose-1-phosphate uridylyltransferase n=1 Tax=Actinomortierella ambigua TaxID=1343610 RepID=A0A9P6TZA2_9FUNG|nr:hypothetical protein DFQ27_007737 [Actinomortierella ambigua]